MFDDLDNKACAFRRKINNWLRSAETERKSSKGSSVRSESRRSKSSGRSNKSRSSRARELEEKARIAELMAKTEYIEQRQRAENQAEMLKIQREIANSKAREKFMVSMIQDLLMVEVSYQMTNSILLKDFSPEI